MSSTTFGAYLDLKVNGATMSPYPLAECPDNGYVFVSEQPPDAAEKDYPAQQREPAVRLG